MGLRTWSLLNRGIGGTYSSVEPFFLFRYIDEQVYRSNLKDVKDMDRFDVALRQLAGKPKSFPATRFPVGGRSLSFCLAPGVAGRPLLGQVRRVLIR